MTDVDRLFAEFVAEDRARVADPAPYLARAGSARAELEALLDGYLARAPRRSFDRAAFEASPARAVADALDRSIVGVSGSWPALLPRLRDRARLRRAELVARLAESLGFPDRADRVGGYYHAMEQGTLPASGVSDRVLEALGRIVGESASALRAAGAAMTGPPPAPAPAAAAAPAFARVAEPDEDYFEAVAAAAFEPPPRDEIDELFTGG